MNLADGGFQNFTEKEYQETAKKISDGTISISGEDVAADPSGHGISICKIRQMQ